MPHWRGLLQLLTLLSLTALPVRSAQIQGIPTPWIYVNIANLSSYDAMNNDVAGQPLNGQNGQNPSKLGAKFNHSQYVDRTVGLVLMTWDALTNYTATNDISGLNGGANNNFSTVIYWGAPYGGVVQPCGTLPGPIISMFGNVVVIANQASVAHYTAIDVTFDGSTPGDKLQCSTTPFTGGATSEIPFANSPPSGQWGYDGPFILPFNCTVKACSGGATVQLNSIVTSSNLLSAGEQWSNNVVANGGSSPSMGSVTNMNAFVAGLDNYGLVAVAGPGPVAINIFATDSLVAAMSPLVYVKGPQLWTNNNFVSGDLSVNGLKGNGTSKSINTGILANNSTLTTNSSLSLYNYVNQSHSGNVEFHAAPDATGNNEFALFAVRNTGSGFASLYNEGNGLVTGTMTANFQGFQTASRIGTGAASGNMWVGNSSIIFTNIGVDNNSTALGSPVAQFMTVFAANLGGTIGDWSSNTISYVSIFQGHNAVASSNEFILVQQLKQGQGGGFR